ncbi:hypothetical protein Clacol_002577 [Clathrus columnatus]|uniref:ASTRA-associated protein 1 n=1 Tax=Clathrus columnatus TaxID=1419009 RepID=A0AAV5A585_9AGAM|nr:hypothetical protein Clacol_002577 [Clathrus columnatus]
MPPAPAPVHILRCHSAQINTLYFSHDNKRLYSGDLLGQVFITSTETLRTITSWKPHNDVRHGRDNKLHIWERIVEPHSLADVATPPSVPVPSLQISLDVNALNYCRFSLLLCDKASSNAMVAVPNLVDSSLVDVWAIPSVDRLHAAVGSQDAGTQRVEDGRGHEKTGIVMGLHLFEDHSANELRLLMSFENGGLALWATANVRQKTVQGRGWQRLWNIKSHVESGWSLLVYLQLGSNFWSPVMAMSVTYDNTVAFTVSADNLLCKYSLQVSIHVLIPLCGGEKWIKNMKDGLSPTERTVVYRTKHPGNGAIALQQEGRVVAVGGWDGKSVFGVRKF